MKSTIIFLCLILGIANSFAQTQQIQFENVSFEYMKTKAKQEGKLIFVDAFTTWCGPCKWMSANIFTNDSVAEYYNAHFINAKIDMEKGEGPAFAKLYNVNCYPNLLFIDGDGNLVHLAAGGMNAESFIQLGKTALNPEKRYSKFKNEYESKKYDPVFLWEYLHILTRTCLPYDDIFTGYFKKVKNKDLTSRGNWNIIRDYSSDYKSLEMNYLINNTDKFSQLYSADSVNSKIKFVLLNSGYRIFSMDSVDSNYLIFKDEVSKLNTSCKDEVLFNLDLIYFEQREEWDDYIDLAVAKGDLYFQTLLDFNNSSWYIFNHSNDEATLKKAESWMKTILEAKENQEWYAYDTYAAILLKLKKKQEALDAVQKAILLAQSSGVDEDELVSTYELVEKIKGLD